MDKIVKKGSVIRFQRSDGEQCIGTVISIKNDTCRVMYEKKIVDGSYKPYTRTVYNDELIQVISYECEKKVDAKVGEKSWCDCSCKMLFFIIFMLIFVISLIFHHIFKKVRY